MDFKYSETVKAWYESDRISAVDGCRSPKGIFQVREIFTHLEIHHNPDKSSDIKSTGIVLSAEEVEVFAEE